MRHLLVALMIVLLPLRGWMGDAMAISMMNLQPGGGAQAHAMSMPNPVHDMAPQSKADLPQDGAQAGVHGDCAGMMMMAAAAPESAGDSAGAMTGCESCPVCQACSIVVMGADPLRTATPFIPQASPVGTLPHFASAHPRRGQKPPIS